MNKETTKLYRERRNDGWLDTAKVCMHRVRYAVMIRRRAYIEHIPNIDQNITIHLPGVGALVMETHSDSDHDPWDSDMVGYHWFPESTEGSKHCGASFTYNGERWYWIGRSSRDGYMAIKMCHGGDVEDRRGYWQKLGMSKQDAEIRVRASIRKECDYWRRVAGGLVGFVGLTCKLMRDGIIVGEESCWGYEYEDRSSGESYLVESMNEWAESLVTEHAAKAYGGTAPPTFVRGVDPMVDKAWRAWETAMSTSDGDMTLADPVFVATYRGLRDINHGSRHGNPRKRSSRGRGTKVSGQRDSGVRDCASPG